VVGQEHVVRTLSNALEQDRIHHAYLFVGSRGTGKTSMAKILAASLNCQNGGPTLTPCGKCESCVSIQTATSLDVVEMDAASNNSVDDVRDLRERVAYAPVSGRYKVYILDEAHMLTPQAWNAFLKTLEEPPPHTIFVLATTEANKVLPTVVDRCHRFDFGRPSVSQIAAVLRRVADSESIDIPDEAIALVARSATGSFRDALGTLEQLLAYSGAKIVLDDVLAVLGAADADLIFGAVDAVAAGDARSALLAAARLAESGRDIGRFFGDLEAHARALMIVQVLGDVPPELHVTPEQDERLAEQARRVGHAEVVRLIELIATAFRAMKDGADARTQLELALVKAAKPDLEPSVKALLARIDRLESRPAPPAGPKTPERAETAAGRAAATTGRTAVTISAQVEDQPPIAVTTTLPGTAHVEQRAVDDAAEAVAQELATEADPAPAVTAVATVEPDAPGEVNLELSLASFGDVWPAVKDELRERSPMLAAALDEASPAELSSGHLVLAWPETSSFLKRKAEDPASNDQLTKAIRSVTGHSLRLAYELRAAAEMAPVAAAVPALSDDDLVQRFKDEFDAEELPPEPEEQT
jgi:DNA polymerase-3 subunit gamma/tau